MAWKITYEGEVYRDGDLTLDDAERLEELCGTSWQRIDPLYWGAHAKRVTAYLHSKRMDLPYEEVLADVGKLNIDKYITNLMHAPTQAELEEKEARVVADDGDMPSTYDNGIPPVAAEPSTPGSPSSRKPRGSGRLT